PTLLEAFGLPAQPGDGRSLGPLLANPDLSWTSRAITTWLEGNHALRTDEFRYIRYSNGDQELYDHRFDPNEWMNLASHPKSGPLLERLSTELDLTLSGCWP
ncbi:MAG: hypothetical protein HYV07_21040, partial [Deltaproteobacteria bacterium]|nr:hypothetical protein [Deltaproteobacteria bacterium]